MFLDGAFDHLALDRKGLDISIGLAKMEKRLTAGIAKFKKFSALGSAYFSNSEIVVHGPLGCHFQKISIFYDDFTAYYTGTYLHVQLHLCAYATFVADG
jgi:hypothetical protein